MEILKVEVGGETFLLCELGIALFSLHKWSVWRGAKGHIYLRRTVRLPEGKQVTVYFHRELLGLAAGDIGLADHINRDTRDNRRENLRKVDMATNNANRRLKRNGAFKAKNGWISMIQRHGRRRYLGFYATEAEASLAYQQANEGGQGVRCNV